MAAVAHNVLKMVGKLRRSIGPPRPALAAATTAEDAENALAVAVASSTVPPRWFPLPGWLVRSPTSAVRKHQCDRGVPRKALLPV